MVNLEGMIDYTVEPSDNIAYEPLPVGEYVVMITSIDLKDTNKKDGNYLNICYEVIDDGKYKVPYYKIEPILITKDNMQVIINDDFHRIEEVYLNIPKQLWPKIN